MANAEVKGVKVGTANVTAEYEGITASQAIDVTDAVLQSIAIEGETSTPMGITLTVKAMGTFSDGTTKELTEDLTWSATGAATVADGVVTPTEVGEATITVTSGEITGETTITVTDAVPQTLTIGSETGAFETPVGRSLKLTVQANLSDGTSKDITSLDAVKWSSDATTILTVANAEVKGVKVGTANVTAEYEGITASQAIDVTDAVLESIAIEGETSTPMGIELTLKAMGTFSDGTTKELADGMTWSATGSATVADGVVTPTAVGEATITVTDGEVTGEATITVTEAVVQALTFGSETGAFDVPAGMSLKLTLQAELSDGTSKDITNLDAVKWSSDATTILTVANAQVQGLKVGTANVTAEFEGITASQAINVTDAVLQSIAIEGETSTPFGVNLTLKAIGTFSDGSTLELNDGITWAATGLATVLDGVVSPTGVGDVTITATKAAETGDIVGETTITVTEAIVEALTIGSETGSFEVSAGGTLQLTLEATYTDGTSADVTTKDAVSWSSDSSVTLTVSYGEVTALKAGTAMVTAEFGGVTTEQEITVVDGAVLETMTVDTETGEYRTPMGTDLTLLVTGHYSDGSAQPLTTDLDWFSGEESIATVVDGVVTPVSVGTVTITVTDENTGIYCDVDIEVYDADPVLESLSIESATGSFTTRSNANLQLNAIGHFDDGSESYVDTGLTWESLDETLALVDGNGYVTPAGVGTVTITVTDDATGINATVDVEITPALVSLTIESTTGDWEVTEGGTLELYAVGEFEDSSTETVTEGLSWHSDDEAFATVDNGVVTAIAPGDVTVTVTDDETGIYYDVNITVLPST